MLEAQPVVAPSPAPAAPAAPASPAPTAPVAEPQADAAEENVVNLADIIGDKKADALGSGTPKPDDKNAKPSPTPTVDPPKTEDASPYKSQKDVDAAIGKRLSAERAKWEKSQKPVQRIVQTLRDANPGLTDDQIVAQLEADRDEKLGLSPAMSALLKNRGLFGGQSQPSEGEAPPAVEMSAEDQSSAADEIATQAEKIVALDPKFDMTEFLNKNAGSLPAIARGEMTLMDVYLRTEGPAAFERARQAAFEAGKADSVKNIRDRNNQVPGPISPSAPASITRDFSTMSKEEWDRHQKAIKTQQAMGVRVRL